LGDSIPHRVKICNTSLDAWLFHDLKFVYVSLLISSLINPLFLVIQILAARLSTDDLYFEDHLASGDSVLPGCVRLATFPPPRTFSLALWDGPGAVLRLLAVWG
jgi:hypothetical protein